MDGFSVAMIGPYPPPYGGVSVHIQRVHERLCRAGVRSRVYSQPLPRHARRPGVVPATWRFSWKTWVPEHGWRCAADIVHIHEGWYWAPAAWTALRRGKHVVWTFHDQETGNVKWQDASPFERRVSRALFRDPGMRWVAVSPEVRRQLIGVGVPESGIAVIPAYVPPPPGSAQPLPTSVRAFLDAHAPVLSTYGWKLTLDGNGVDIYGFDLCLEAVGRMKADFPRLGLVISLPQIALPDYFARLRHQAAEDGIEDRVLFVTEPLPEVHSLWAASDVFVRATNTDGDAVSVREALSLGIPVVASDATPRPPGVELFPSRDARALETALRRVLADRPSRVRALQSLETVDHFPALFELYRETATGHRRARRGGPADVRIGSS